MIAFERNKCTGCTACFAICPVDAISMIADDEGFLFPNINPDKCIACGLCSTVCPIGNPPKHPFQDCLYATTNANEQERRFSASGGIFPIFARHFLECNGVVCGCILDENSVARHVLTDNPAIVRQMSKSKYVQSDMGNCFRDTLAALEAGQKVLFSGTPCQIAGLHNFLGDNHDNLFTVDFVCHGVPSPKIFARYVEDAKKAFPETRHIWFRNKIFGWARSCGAMTYLDASMNMLSCKLPSEDAYIKSFHKCHTLRRSCGLCEYASAARVSDATLGDFWGISNYAPELNDNKGLSLFLVNTEKAGRLLHTLKQKGNFGLLQKQPFANAKQHNTFNGPLPVGNKRAEIFEHLQKDPNFMQWFNDTSLSQISDEQTSAIAFLRQKKILYSDAGCKIEYVDTKQLEIFVNEHPFDDSLATSCQTALSAAAEWFSTCLQRHGLSSDEHFANHIKNIIWTLLTAEAKRILEEPIHSQIQSSQYYKNYPLGLIPLIQQTIRDRHQTYLIREVERLAGKDVYFFGCGLLYKLKRNLFAKLNPRCILVDYDCEHAVTVNKIAVCKTTAVLPRGEILPIVIFSGKAGIIAQRLRQQYPDYTDIITCTML